MLFSHGGRGRSEQRKTGYFGCTQVRRLFCSFWEKERERGERRNLGRIAETQGPLQSEQERGREMGKSVQGETGTLVVHKY